MSKWPTHLKVLYYPQYDIPRTYPGRFSLALRANSVDVVTFGQYMRPTKRHMKVSRYVEPAEFDMWKTRAEEMGFAYVASGPLVRSSYKVPLNNPSAPGVMLLTSGFLGR